MKRFFFAVALVMACLFVVGGVQADTYDDHIVTAPNGKGDLLVYPVYLAFPGFETQISVINTSLTRSVVAKFVIRSKVYSEELLDFFLYLSPTDMWIGTIKNVGAVPVVYSTDKSGPVYPLGNTILNNKPIKVPYCSGDDNQWGYVEIIEAWSGDLGGPGLAKSVIENAYNQLGEDIPKDATVNSLSGSYTISVNSSTVNWEATDNAVVFSDYKNLKKLSVGATTTLGVDANNNPQEIDAAFNKDAIAMTFNSSADTGSTFHLFTFPTKQSYSDACTRSSKAPSNYFPDNGIVSFKLRAMNNEEGTTSDPDNPFSPQPKELVLTLPDEVNLRSVLKNDATGEIFFDYGWFLYNFDKTLTEGTNRAGETLTYNGTPVIPVVIDINKTLSIRTSAWTDGTVTNGVNPIPAYQYTSKVVVTK